MGNEAAGSNCSVKMKEPWLALWGSGGCQGSSSGARRLPSHVTAGLWQLRLKLLLNA